MSNSQHSFFFGQKGQALLGVYSAPSSTVSQRSHGVLLCPAFGQEYLRSHRAMRQLGLMLAREGFHVLKFDYFGSGDSNGQLEQADIKRWLRDISSARQELLNISGCAKMSVIGLRLGGTLAALHAGETNQDAWDSITLWEPVISGTEYLREFGHSNEQPIDNIMGFPITQQLRNEIAAIDLLQLNSLATKKLDCVSSSSSKQLATLLDSVRQNIEVSEALIPIAGDWSKTDEFLSAMLPREMILRIIQGMITMADA
jgi:pimeloyl-ACP methyl ester carboxylesterase